MCKISEFGCRGGRCISADKYCDGVDHCGDGSDEPRWCTRKSPTFSFFILLENFLLVKRESKLKWD